jgi:5-methylcytosine-specific restriction endonuclease McrA
MILDLLASGAMSLTSVRILRPHLTPENHEAVLARASRRSRRAIEALVAEVAPRPDVPSSVRKLPTATPAATLMPAATLPAPHAEAARLAPPPPAPPISSPPLPMKTGRPIIETTSPERYRVQFTIGKESHDKLRRLQTLLRREIPDGDPGAIFDRALTLLLEKVEKTKLGAAAKPRPTPIRPAADRQLRTPVVLSRDLPRDVKRGAWRRDGGQCAFVSGDGHRCTERAFLEFHHILPYAKGGLATVENISLRCRRHNQYESELVFGPRPASRVREEQVSATGAGRCPDVTRPWCASG